MGHLTDDIRDGLSELGDTIRTLGADKSDRLQQALEAFRDPQAIDLTLLQGLFAALRPRRGEGDAAAVARFGQMIVRLREDPTLAAAFRRHYMHYFTSRRLLGFFADSGILPDTGFFSEWSRILVHRVLPKVPDETDARACIPVFLNHPDDWRWLSAVPDAELFRFWQLLTPIDSLDESAWQAIVQALLDAMRLLALRIAGLGMDSSLLEASVHLNNYAPSFFELPAETEHYYRTMQAYFADPGLPVDDGKHLLVIVDQCLDALNRARKHFLQAGTSLHLTYLLTRCEQSLLRLQELTLLMQTLLYTTTVVDALTQDAAGAQTVPGLSSGGRHHVEVDAGLRAWSQMVHRAFVSENRSYNFSDYWDRLSELMALRVAETAAQSGEHYVCTTPREYRGMWLSAMGAGVFIGGMALLKIFAGELHASLFLTALMYSLVYGLGFTVIYLLGFTVATKQPAMTAQTLVSQINHVSPTRPEDLSAIVDLIAAVFRSQLAAIAGNILVAFPMAILLGLGVGHWLGMSPVSADKAAHLLQDLDLFGWAIPHAALAGVFLYLAGLLSGYFDNRAAHSRLGERIAYLPFLRKWLGQERAQRFGAYIGRHLGGIMGNFLFGCMLGSAGVIGIILGLPIDIRHIAFASANLGYAIVGSETLPAWYVLAWAIVGVLCIGLTNLVVSFTLALRTAFRARRLSFSGSRLLRQALWQRLRTAPRSFFLPPRRRE